MKINSKIIAGLFAAFIFVVGASQVSAAWMATTSMKITKASSAADVMWLQETLNAVSNSGLVVDGKYGPKTTAAIKAFQASHPASGIADGIAGKLTIAALNAAGVNLTGTAALCPNGMTLASNCMTAPTQTPAVALCPNGMTIASNCSTAPSGTTPVVTGGAGDIKTVEVLSSVSNEKVGEGDVAHKVFAYTVEADNGSNINISSVKLDLVMAGNGSNKINRYASNVSVWMGGTKVGSANVSEFSESNDHYSKSIALYGAVVPANQKATFYVAVDALPNIDSTDLASNTWTVLLESQRFTDGTGAVLTDSTGSISKTFQFASLATANDVELKVQLSSSNMAARTVKVSTTSDTNQVELLKFTMKAQGSNMVIDQIPVSFTTTGTLNEVTGNVTLKIAGNTYNESVTNVASTAVVNFDDLNLSLSKDATVEGVVYADISDIESPTFNEGITLKAEITSALVAATSGNYIDVEDMNGDALSTNDRTGSAVGEVMTFRSTGVNTVIGTTSYSQTTDQNGLVTSVTYSIPVAVTSFGNTLYLGQTAQLAASVSGSNAFNVVIEDSSNPTAESVSGTASITLSSSNATIESNGFRLDDGTTKNFTINVNLTSAALNSSNRVRLDQIKTFTEAGLVTGTVSDLLPQTNFRTDYRLINN